MKLSDNPIFLTQKRLVHRTGLVAALVIAILVGGSLFFGLLANLAGPMPLTTTSVQETGKIFYGWAIGLEILILIIGGANRISQSLGNDRKAGLWDSNRLTPLKPSRLVIGYWFGAPLREFYMAVIFAIAGLFIVLIGRLPLTLWLGTQVLIFSTACFFGLLAVVTALVLQRPQAGTGVIVAFIFLQFPALAVPKFSVTNFLLPVYPIAHLFNVSDEHPGGYSVHDWYGTPEFFALPIYPVLLSLGLQAVIGFFLWRAAVRKATNPFRPPLCRSEAVALFGILLATQHALMWPIWTGNYPVTGINTHGGYDDADPFMPIVHAATLMLAAIILDTNSPRPETIRLGALRTGSKNLGPIYRQSAVTLAVILTAVLGLVLFTQFVHSLESIGIYLIAVGNFLSFCVIVALLLEFCRLRYGRRAPGFIALWIFVLCGLPLILALVLSTSAIAKVSLLAPGVVALYGAPDENFGYLTGIVIAHLGVAVLLFLGWRRQWQRLLEKAV